MANINHCSFQFPFFSTKIDVHVMNAINTAKISNAINEILSEIKQIID